MARDRARSSFTVEVRRGRTSGIDADPKNSLWRGLDLAGEAARHDGIATPAPRSAAGSPASPDPFAQRPRVQPRETLQGRVLPSLLPTTNLVEESQPEPEASEILARVRRPRPVRPTSKAVEAVVADGVVEIVSDDDADGDAPTVEAAAGAVVQPRLRRREPRGERVLRAGERWKRRLPRSLW